MNNLEALVKLVSANETRAILHGPGLIVRDSAEAIDHIAPQLLSTEELAAFNALPRQDKE